MNELKNSKVDIRNLEEKYDAFPLHPVPKDLRANWFSLVLVWFGYTQCTTNLLSGATIGNGLQLIPAILSVLLGNTILCVIATIQGFASQKTGYSTYYLTRFSFGRHGAKFISLLFGISFMGWAGVGIGIAAETLSTLILVNKQLLALVCSFLFAITAIFGFKGMEHLGKITIPVVYFISVFGIVKLLEQKGISFGEIFKMMPADKISFSTGVAITIGSWIVGTIASPDLNRFAKTKKDIVISSILTFIVGNSFLYIIGIILAIISETWNLPVVLTKIGFGTIGTVMLIFLAWSVADNDYYAAGLGLANFSDKKYSLIPTVIAVLGGTIVAVFGIYDYFFHYLMILAYVFPPVGGIMMIDYLFFPAIFKDKLPLRNKLEIRAFIIWLISIAVSIFYEEYSAPVVGLCTAMILYFFVKFIGEKFSIK